MHMQTQMETVGRAFAQALGSKDFGAIAELLDDEIDFRALTPRRSWEAFRSRDVIGEILTTWFDESDRLDEIESIETNAIADRQRVSYRFRGVNPDGPFVVEQQAYYTESDGRINWMRVLCSGFRPT